MGCGDRATASKPEASIPVVRAAEVTRTRPRATTRHLVLLEPARRARLAARLGGQVKALAVAEQSRVATGDVLVELEAEASRGALVSARAAVSRIEAELADSGRELKSARSLEDRGVENRRSVERTETRRAALEAQLREARGNLIQAKDRADASQIVAPFGGVVTRIDTELGEYLQPGAVAAVVAELDPLVAELMLTEDEIAGLDRDTAGFSASIRGRPVPVELEWVAQEAEPGTSTFRARLRIANGDGGLRAGETADIEVRTGGAVAAALGVPATAVRWSSGQAYVLRVESTQGQPRVERVDVDVVDDAEALVIVRGELKEGQSVVSTGPFNLAPGDTVQVEARDPTSLAAR